MAKNNSIKENTTNLTLLIDNLENNQYGEFKLHIYDNNRVVRIKNEKCIGFLGKRCNIKPHKIPNSKMSILNLNRTLSKKREELLKLSIDNKKCLMLTLTTKPESSMSYCKMKSAVDSFMKSIKRNFEYEFFIKRYEYTKKHRLHTHILLVFTDAFPILLTKQWVKQHWKYGNQVYVSQFSNPYNIVGYITKPDKNAKYDDKYTLFDSNANFLKWEDEIFVEFFNLILYSSQNFFTMSKICIKLFCILRQLNQS